jgi:hypothetical protein
MVSRTVSPNTAKRRLEPMIESSRRSPEARRGPPQAIQLPVQLQERPLLAHHFLAQQGYRRTSKGQKLIVEVMPPRLIVRGCRA